MFMARLAEDVGLAVNRHMDVSKPWLGKAGQVVEALRTRNLSDNLPPGSVYKAQIHSRGVLQSRLCVLKGSIFFGMNNSFSV